MICLLRGFWQDRKELKRSSFSKLKRSPPNSGRKQRRCGLQQRRCTTPEDSLARPTASVALIQSALTMGQCCPRDAQEKSLYSMVSESCSVLSDSLRPHGLYAPWNSPGQDTGVGSLSLLQGIIPTQGSNPGLPHCRGLLCQLSHKGGPRSRGPSEK